MNKITRRTLVQGTAQRAATISAAARAKKNVNDDEASATLSRDYRAGFVVPKIA